MLEVHIWTDKKHCCLKPAQLFPSFFAKKVMKTSGLQRNINSSTNINYRSYFFHLCVAYTQQPISIHIESNTVVITVAGAWFKATGSFTPKLSQRDLGKRLLCIPFKKLHFCTFNDPKSHICRFYCLDSLVRNIKLKNTTWTTSVLDDKPVTYFTAAATAS